MSLILPPFYFGYTTDNLHRVAAPAATPGQQLTANANNADGTVLNLSFANAADNGTVTALEYDVCGIMIGFNSFVASNGDSSTLVDLLVDRAGGTSYSQLISDLVAGYTPVPTAGAISTDTYYYFPLWIPAGASLGMQARTAHTVNIAGRACVWLFCEPSRPDAWWCGQGVESLGVVPATSKGVNHTPGNAAWSTWATVGTSTYRYRAVQFGHNGTDAAGTAVNSHWEIGYGSQRLGGAPRFHVSTSTAESSQRSGFGMPIFCNVPAGTTWQTRAWSSAAAEVNTVAIYGVY
jgi:hypothetical protein